MVKEDNRQQATPAPAPSRIVLGEQDTSRILNGFAIREEIIGLLCNTNPADAIGAALAFVALAAQRHPDMVRQSLDSTVTGRDGLPHRVKTLLRL